MVRIKKRKTSRTLIQVKGGNDMNGYERGGFIPHDPKEKVFADYVEVVLPLSEINKRLDEALLKGSSDRKPIGLMSEFK